MIMIFNRHSNSYTDECDYYMETVIRNYPGIQIVTETDTDLTLKVTSEAGEFLNFLNDCDMIELL